MPLFKGRLWEAILKIPALYLGRKSLRDFRAFCCGYESACKVHRIEDDATHLPRDFHDWVAYRTHFRESTAGWCNMICSVTNSAAEAFDRFFELLDEYNNRQPHVIARCLNSRRVYETPKGEDGTGGVIRYPASIALITYTDDPGFFVVSEIPGETLLSIGGFMPEWGWLGDLMGELVILDAHRFAALQKPTNIVRPELRLED
jgi:hypothetical protein